jgi:hypothetical protein
MEDEEKDISLLSSFIITSFNFEDSTECIQIKVRLLQHWQIWGKVQGVLKLDPLSNPICRKCHFRGLDLKRFSGVHTTGPT